MGMRGSIQKLLSSFFKQMRFCICLIALLTIAACTNQHLSRISSPLTSSSSTPDTTEKNESGINLKTVSMAANGNDNQIDLTVSDNSIGSICGTSDAYGAAPLGCSIDYEFSDFSGHTIRVPGTLLYADYGLARADFSAYLFSGVVNFKVRLKNLAKNKYSNALSITLSQGIAPFSNPENLISVSRFQCRDALQFPHPFNGASGALSQGLYDPVQMESLNVARPLNFYRGDAGRDLASWASNDAAKSGTGQPTQEGYGWFCPQPSRDDSFRLLGIDVGNKIDYRIFSTAPDNGIEQIYPVQPGTRDRYNFVLFRKPTGIFNKPLSVGTGPMTKGILGYGAQGYENSEGCPGSSVVSIPQGYQWVKVWLWKATLTPRVVASSTDLVSHANRIVCNPGAFLSSDGNTAMGPVFPDCNNSGFDPIKWYTDTCDSSQGACATTHDSRLNFRYTTKGQGGFVQKLDDRVILNADSNKIHACFKIWSSTQVDPLYAYLFQGDLDRCGAPIDDPLGYWPPGLGDQPYGYGTGCSTKYDPNTGLSALTGRVKRDYENNFNFATSNESNRRQVGLGSDIWRPARQLLSQSVNGATVTANCGGSSSKAPYGADPFGLCRADGTTDKCEADDIANGNGKTTCSNRVPMANHPKYSSNQVVPEVDVQFRNIVDDLSEYIITVSPPSVTFDQMQNNVDIKNLFKPYRFYKVGDCPLAQPSTDPNNCAKPNQRIDNYELELRDLDSNTIAPFCALQKVSTP